MKKSMNCGPTYDEFDLTTKGAPSEKGTFFAEIGNLKFAVDYNAHREMMDPRLGLERRFRAAYVNLSFGNFCRFVCDRSAHVVEERGRKILKVTKTPVSVADLARKMNVSYRVLQKLAHREKQHGYIQVEGQTLFVVAQPSAEPAEPQKPLVVYSDVEAAWRAEHPDQAAEWDLFREGNERFRRIVQAEYWAKRRAVEKERAADDTGASIDTGEASAGEGEPTSADDTPTSADDNLSSAAGSNGGGILIELTVNSTDSEVGRSVSPEETDRPTQSAVAEIKELLTRRLGEQLKDLPSDGLCRKVHARLGGASLLELDARITLRWNAITSMGMVELLAKDVGVSHAKLEQIRTQDERTYQEQQERQHQAVVRDVRHRWSELTEPDREWYRENVPDAVPDQKARSQDA